MHEVSTPRWTSSDCAGALDDAGSCSAQIKPTVVVTDQREPRRWTLQIAAKQKIPGGSRGVPQRGSGGVLGLSEKVRTKSRTSSHPWAAELMLRVRYMQLARCSVPSRPRGDPRDGTPLKSAGAKLSGVQRERREIREVALGPRGPFYCAQAAGPIAETLGPGRDAFETSGGLRGC